MLADSLKFVLASEFEATQIKEIIISKSQASIKSAREEGEESIIRTVERAKSEIAHLQKTADHKTMEAAAELASSTANRLATMRARAEKRMDIVAERIFERIISV